MPKKSANRVTETEVAEAVLKVLGAYPNGQAAISAIVKAVPNHLKLSDQDCTPSATRTNEEMWEQQVRNITSHKSTPGNFICEGYLESVSGGLRLTEAGRKRL